MRSALSASPVVSAMRALAACPAHVSLSRGGAPSPASGVEESAMASAAESAMASTPESVVASAPESVAADSVTGASMAATSVLVASLASVLPPSAASEPPSIPPLDEDALKSPRMAVQATAPPSDGRKSRRRRLARIIPDTTSKLARVARFSEPGRSPARELRVICEIPHCFAGRLGGKGGAFVGWRRIADGRSGAQLSLPGATAKDCRRAVAARHRSARTRPRHLQGPCPPCRMQPRHRRSSLPCIPCRVSTALASPFGSQRQASLVCVDPCDAIGCGRPSGSPVWST